MCTANRTYMFIKSIWMVPLSKSIIHKTIATNIINSILEQVENKTECGIFFLTIFKPTVLIKPPRYKATFTSPTISLRKLL
ncbi:hypothetical protein GUJ93_ZPchr0010g7399 [Zizania palustris]|uniref:Uncharacterized protein n=1 Tax=Zizania palustris TaxID=103762 RepID=A0A8J5WDX7_ZIZPA|nr:hypothetical protein GUJ93_ZPchr0010g7399 [Zizania palustris]